MSRIVEITLDNLLFYAHHGVFGHETRDGNEFEVNIRVVYTEDSPEGKFTSGESERTQVEENLDDTVSYARLYEITREEMAVPRQLLETVSRAIAEKIKSEFPSLSIVECKICKKRPPIAGMTGSASVSYRISED